MTQGFSGVGTVHIYKRNSDGTPGIGRFIGNSNKLTLAHDPKSVERNSSMDAARGPLRRMTQASGASLTLVTDEEGKKNWALATHGRVDEVAADTSTTIQVTHPTGAAVGDMLQAGKNNINTFTLVDSTGTPKTLTLNTNYTVDLFSGDITLIDLTTGGPFVQPFKSSFKQGAVTHVAGLVATDEEVWVHFNGVNVDTGEKVVADFYRVRFDPASEVDLINPDYLDLTLKGAALYDTTKTSAGVGGNMYKLTKPSTSA